MWSSKNTSPNRIEGKWYEHTVPVIFKDRRRSSGTSTDSWSGFKGGDTETVQWSKRFSIPFTGSPRILLQPYFDFCNSKIYS